MGKAEVTKKREPKTQIFLNPNFQFSIIHFPFIP
jgi:hypothetical protein